MTYCLRFLNRAHFKFTNMRLLFYARDSIFGSTKKPKPTDSILVSFGGDNRTCEECVARRNSEEPARVSSTQRRASLIQTILIIDTRGGAAKTGWRQQGLLLAQKRNESCCIRLTKSYLHFLNRRRVAYGGFLPVVSQTHEKSTENRCFFCVGGA